MTDLNSNKSSDDSTALTETSTEVVGLSSQDIENCSTLVLLRPPLKMNAQPRRITSPHFSVFQSSLHPSQRLNMSYLAADDLSTPDISALEITKAYPANYDHGRVMEKQPVLTEFLIFKNFSQEIQDHIWKTVANEPRVIPYDIGFTGPYPNTLRPPVYYVCKDSHNIVKKLHKSVLCTDFRGRIGPALYVNPDADTLWFVKRGLSLYVDPSAVLESGIKSVAVSSESLEIYILNCGIRKRPSLDFATWLERACMAGLDEILLVIGGASPELMAQDNEIVFIPPREDPPNEETVIGLIGDSGGFESTCHVQILATLGDGAERTWEAAAERRRQSMLNFLSNSARRRKYWQVDLALPGFVDEIDFKAIKLPKLRFVEAVTRLEYDPLKTWRRMFCDPKDGRIKF